MTQDYTYGYRMTSKGHLLTNKKKNNESFVVLNNNKEKTYLLSEGMIIPPLIDLGVMTKEGKVVKAYYDKFKQINRFLSIIEDALKDFNKDSINIIDFGCGKSYLTFIVYYYLTYVKKIKAVMTGLDLKEDVIKHCNEIAKKYNYENLSFEIGDISLYQPKEYCDMIITLHACDTATDFAMYHAIMLKTKYLLSVPCCQHEINLQLDKSSDPLITKYGLVKDRLGAIITDSIRANILEYEGYDVSMIEFIDFAQTPKNILIRAIKKNENKKEESLKLVEDTLKKYNIHQTLYDLITKN
ncbi:MAG: SAM-dependent methyltransferase [Acholeplasmatales bacterium]|nr:SAM-dependent methyltransferase [Acholeplasmatales bacterium]